jgi:hypothetical protein
MLAALLSGFVIGAAFGAYLLFAVVSPADLKGGSTPNELYFDSEGNYPQYRDYYAARAAERFVSLGGAASEQALAAARDELGVTTGEVSPADALAMVRGAASVASRENAGETNPDAGRFTLQDQQNLAALSDRLAATQTDVVSAAAQAEAASQNLLRIGGLIGLIVLILAVAVLLWLLVRALAPRELVTDSSSDNVRLPTASSDGAPTAAPARRTVIRRAPAESQPAAESAPATRESVRADSRVIAPETDAGAPRRRGAGPAVTSDGPLAATDTRPAANGEQRIGAFNTVYQIGDDRYDESFPIQGTMGDLIGECGASIVERVDVGTPARVVAVAIWLFDKADFQSTTKVLMTDFAFTDTAVRTKLRNRGDAVQARLGSFDIVTSSLRVEVEVTMLECAPVGGASNGYFEKLGLRFNVYRK